MTDVTTASEHALESAIRQLADQWFSSKNITVAIEEADPDVVLNSVGFANAAAECVLAFLDIDPNNRIPRGILARSTFEIGLRAVWLSLTGIEGLEALQFEDSRQRQTLAKEFLKSDLTLVLRGAARKAAEQASTPKPKRAEEAKSVLRMVDVIDSGSTPLYAIYRLYSGYAHASLNVANSYVFEDGDGNLSIRTPGRQTALDDHLGTAVAPFVWAVRAVSRMIGDHTLNSRLEAIREILGTSIDFKLRTI